MQEKQRICDSDVKTGAFVSEVEGYMDDEPWSIILFVCLVQLYLAYMIMFVALNYDDQFVCDLTKFRYFLKYLYGSMKNSLSESLQVNILVFKLEIQEGNYLN